MGRRAGADEGGTQTERGGPVQQVCTMVPAEHTGCHADPALPDHSTARSAAEMEKLRLVIPFYSCSFDPASGIATNHVSFS